MKTLLITLLCASPVLFVGGRILCDTIYGSSETAAVRGRYLEARSASVFAGACHINGEASSQGRRALVAWSIEDGEHGGVALDGVRIACAVSSSANLADGEARTAVAYLDASLEPERRDAAVAWLRERQAGTVGEVETVSSVALTLEFEGDDYRLDIPGVASLRGKALADRSCCSMESEVWYEPLANVDAPVVGNSAVCRFDGDGGIEGWSYQNENNSFVAYFRDRTDCGAAQSCAPMQTLCCGESFATEPAISE